MDDKKYWLDIWHDDASVYIQPGIRVSLGKPSGPGKLVSDSQHPVVRGTSSMVIRMNYSSNVIFG